MLGCTCFALRTCSIPLPCGILYLTQGVMADNSKIYLDCNATTPLDEEVIEAVTQALRSGWANPSSSHDPGKNAKEMVDKARYQVANMISAKCNEVIFTSGGTESNNLVIHTAVEHFKQNAVERGFDEPPGCPHVVTTTIEHDSIKLPLQNLEKRREIDVTFVPVSKVTGCVEVHDVVSALRLNTCLVTVMLANNETGVIQPVKEVASAVRDWSNRHKKRVSGPVLLHTDAAQAIGKIPVDVTDLGIDYLTIVGHKFYGPRNGALFVRSLGDVCPLFPQLFGGGQERSYRPGTENTPMIVGLGKAAELVANHLTTYSTHFSKMKTYLENKLVETFGELVHFNSRFGESEILPNTINVSITMESTQGYKVLSACKRLLASVGAACHSQESASTILLASGIPLPLARNAIRMSVGRETGENELNAAVDDLKQAVNSLTTRSRQ